MRAFYYWLMTSFFGDIPFYTDDVSDEAMLEKVAKLPRMSAVETRDWLIKDLQECLPSMSQVRSSEITDNRAGAAVGYMLISSWRNGTENGRFHWTPARNWKKSMAISSNIRLPTFRSE